MLKRKRLAIIAASAVSVAGFATVFAATPATPAPVEVAVEAPLEDEPGWNCYVHGNGSCGDVLNLVSDGAVLSAATDGKVYVSWKDGTVTHATQEQRYAAWGKCLDDAWYSDDPSDEAVQECDDSFMEPGDAAQFADWDTDGAY